MLKTNNAMRYTTSSSYLPTRREVLLVVVLLVVLLFVSENDYLLSWDGRSGGSTSLFGVSSRTEHVGYPEPVFSWTEGEIPETEILAHAFGWTIFDRLYIMNGTMFIVSSNASAVPPLKHITSSGYPIENDPEEVLKRFPTDKDMQVITPSEAQRRFGTTRAMRIDGVNFLVNDPKQFVTHYYHWTAEMLFGLWRTYSSLDPNITPTHTSLPPPRRLLFTHINSTSWRDYASLNQWVTRGAFPGIAFEFSDDWADRASMSIPFVFERVVLADRAAAMEGPFFNKTWRTASEAFALRGGKDWWTPVRANVLLFSGVEPEWIYGPDMGLKDHDRGTNGAEEKYVITYVSRQDWGRRMLNQGDHDALVRELYALRDEYGYEVNVVSMDKISRAEQFQLAGRTTILMGVHGNGLTSLVWMRPTPRSTVIEFFCEGGFAFDYEYTTRALGMKHYGVQGNRLFTRPNVPDETLYPECFQGNDIRVDGPVVARLVHSRIALEVPEGEEGLEEVV